MAKKRVAEVAEGWVPTEGETFWEFPQDKAASEIGGIRFALECFFPTFTNLRLRPENEDPPDCEADIDGKPCGIEDTFLMEPKARSARAKGEYMRVEWTRDKLLADLQARIDDKDGKKLKGGPYDRYILLIRTDEFDLDPDAVTEWLGGSTFKAKTITDVLFVMSCSPMWFKAGKGKDGYPVFRLALVRG
jgi:hypothetical protein